MFAGILAKQIDPYEGAFEAYRLLRSGRRWDHSGWSHDDRGHVVNDRPELWTRDLRRPILAHMTEWWERRDAFRDRVEAEIVRFANAWTSGAEDAIANDRSAWRAWMTKRASRSRTFRRRMICPNRDCTSKTMWTPVACPTRR